MHFFIFFTFISLFYMNLYAIPNEYQIAYKGHEQADYLLPEDSFLKASLDIIFSNSHVLKNPKTFAAAGFDLISARSTGMYVASHPDLPGHLIKAYIQSKKSKKNWCWAVTRCMIARKIADLIKEKGLVHFEVPNKWIYPLSKNFIYEGQNLCEENSQAVLIVTHMNLVDKKETVKAWKNATKRQVEELYCIISHGYASCTLCSNIPLTQNGKFACIDTENLRPYPSYHHVNRHLSKEMSDYWDYLVKTGGKGLPF